MTLKVPERLMRHQTQTQSWRVQPEILDPVPQYAETTGLFLSLSPLTRDLAVLDNLGLGPSILGAVSAGQASGPPGALRKYERPKLENFGTREGVCVSQPGHIS